MPQPRAGTAAAPAGQQPPPDPRIERREGNRWVGNPPPPEDVAAWWQTVHLDEGMEHAWFLGGIVLIPQKEKAQRVDGRGQIVRVERLVWTPYAKVETRVAYLRILAELRGWVWEIENVPPTEPDPVLGPNFSRYVIPNKSGQPVHHVVCSKQVVIHQPDVRSGGRGKLILRSSPGTKIVAVHGGYEGAIDPNVLAKAETGAVRRAIGMAGFLVIPGSGIATAEDMAGGNLDAAPGDEPVQPPGVEQPEAAAEARSAAPPEDQMRARIADLRQQVESDAPGKMDELAEWFTAKKINLDDLKESQLRTTLRKLEQALEG